MTTDNGAATRQRQAGYSIVIPPGWARLDTGADVDRQVDALVTRAFAGRGVDETARARRELADRLRAMAREAAGQGVLAVYFPFEESAGAPAPVSLAVAAMHTKGQSDPMATLLAIASQDPTAQAVDLPGSVALRTTRTAPANLPADGPVADDADAGPELDDAVADALGAAVPVDADADATDGVDSADVPWVRRELRYLVGDPGDSRRWLSFVLVSTLPDAPEPQELADVFEELVDALMLTFAWED
ncbi:hypothetical protein [Actinotalea fermentans]|uniref:Uncharacterized protein n=1 Tax=Actinotalea fermentans TaxID=43671 RepID=A0A511YZ74_9CELL|nr:hypothetical protein [Actinotalea fermentans]KGM15732.1 hypothetical protein N867_06040 [Actinotalea fermentans ATCC 43279 = JCM 9966 = DSM 3133]GEN80484.1 hypothetical protein AFE02nite_22180 [Actinotalea fermentans]